MLLIRNVLIFIFLFGIENAFGQNESKKIDFEVYESEKNPLPGVTIIIKNSNPTIGTQTDFNGKATLNLIDFDVDVELSYLGPYTKFKLIDNIDCVKVYIDKRRVVFYSNNKVVKKIKYKKNGY
jgi:hypothetical protein